MAKCAAHVPLLHYASRKNLRQTGIIERQARILVVDDDPIIRDALIVALGGVGYDVKAEGDIVAAQTVAQRFDPEVAILDVRLPVKRQGYELARQLRISHDTAIIFFTAADMLEDRLEGFECGADDYIVKPASLGEILARVHAVVRRRSARVHAGGRRQVGDLRIDEFARTAVRGGNKLDLTRTEFDLLCVLVRHRGNVLSAAQLLRLAWPVHVDNPNAVQVQVAALRRKLDALGPQLIHTVRGVGYVLRD